MAVELLPRKAGITGCVPLLKPLSEDPRRETPINVSKSTKRRKRNV